MEFGKLEDISGVDWNLPTDDPKNTDHLSSTSNTDHMLYFGSPAWANKLWLGKIYPKGTETEKFLYHYSRNFNCIELNSSHYRIPNEETVREWMAEVPSHFKFCPKVHKDISHSRTGIYDKELLGYWFSFLGNIKGHLGPSFIQFHEKFSYAEKGMLFRFLETWPDEFKLTLELRHPSWFNDHKILPALADYLHKKNIGLVITDVAGRRDVLHTTVTTDWTMIRLIGNDDAKSDVKRLHDWSRRLNAWKKAGLKETYLMLHAPDDVMTIEFAQKASAIFTVGGFSNLPSFEFAQENDLFSGNW